ncbi:MAG: CopD family protein, partial [Actinomycetota bacterium]|nr:CopD family protein [Actinomycetota bacterium]
AQPGIPRLTRLAAELGGFLALKMPRRGVAAGFVVAALAAMAAGGHAAATRPAWWGVTADTAHLAAAGLWAGGILALAALRPSEGWRSDEARALLHRFSPVAVGAFLATVAFGSLRGTQELVRFGDLFATSYGQVLTLKILAVALMLPLSLRAWRRRDPRPRIEGGLAVVAIGAAALLAAYPVPPRRAAEDVEAHVTGSDQAVPREGDLTFGGDTGDVLVGLTLRPGRPGRNDVLVYLLPTEGKEAAADLSAKLTAGDETVPLTACGLTCRGGEAVLEDGDTLEVRVAGVDDGPARFALPDLPAPDGRPLLTELVGRMDQVSSLRYEEVFGPVAPPIRSSVEMVAPDRIRVVVHTFDRETIRIGDDMFRREAGQPWEVELDGARVHVPSYIWEYEPRVAAHIVGRQELGGVPTHILSFFIDHSTSPIWYRLWVDDRGLVRRAEMRARGHFMDHDYSDFDAPITVQPPVAVAQVTDAPARR